MKKSFIKGELTRILKHQFLLVNLTFGCFRNNSLHIYFAAIQTELLKVKQKIKAQKDKEKAAYAKMFA